MTALSDCFRQLISVDITNRNIPNIINRGKAAAQLVTAIHREQIMEAKRESAKKIITITQDKRTKKLAKKNS